MIYRLLTYIPRKNDEQFITRNNISIGKGYQVVKFMAHAIFYER